VQHYLSLNRDISSGGGNAGIIKNGLGTLLLYGVNGYTGDTLVNAGVLYVSGTQTGSNVFLKPGSKLSGDGATGSVQSKGATIVPQIYHTSGTPSTHLRTKNLVMDAASTLEILIDEDYLFDTALVSVAGTVNLGGCQLDAELDITGGLSPAVGVPFVIIQNDAADPVVGTFAGLAEGALFKFSGRQWKITYQGGDGNDVMVTLKSLQLPLSLDSITHVPSGNYWILKGNGDPADNTYIMQSSPDLKTWANNGISENSNGNLTGYGSTDGPKHFFRFVKPGN
jgi:autotransporter-associated beta strand protein